MDLALFFSVNEERIIKIIGRKKMTISDITDSFYDYSLIPINGRVYVASVIRRIKKKCEYYPSLMWTFDGRGNGRAGRTVWRIKK